MSDTDPHIHVARKVVEAGADFRSAVTSLLGVVPSQPSETATGCDRRVPLAMTATRPESVTCLPCREHAHREYLALADQFARLSEPPGLTITGITREQVTEAITRLRDLAARFAN